MICFGSSFSPPPVTFSLMHWTDLAVYLYSESHYCWRVGFVCVQVSVWANLATITLSVWIYLFSPSLWLSPIILCFFHLKSQLKANILPFIASPPSKQFWRLKKCLNVIALEIYISNQVAFALKCCVFFFYIAFLQPFMLNQLVFGMIFGGCMTSFLLKFNLNLSNIQNRQQYLILCCF